LARVGPPSTGTISKKILERLTNGRYVFEISLRYVLCPLVFRIGVHRGNGSAMARIQKLKQAQELNPSRSNTAAPKTIEEWRIQAARRTRLLLRVSFLDRQGDV
jgi:hypothetical protein